MPGQDRKIGRTRAGSAAGRSDPGDRLEVINGLEEGDMISPNPGDVVREGLKVDPVPIAEKESDHPAPASAGK